MPEKNNYPKINFERPDPESSDAQTREIEKARKKFEDCKRLFDREPGRPFTPTDIKESIGYKGEEHLAVIKQLLEQGYIVEMEGAIRKGTSRKRYKRKLNG